MKIAATLLLIPVVALAQAPTQQAPGQGPGQGPGQKIDRSKMLEHMKQSMLPMMERSLPEMEKTRQCVQASSNTAELKQCAEIMQAFQKRMIAEMAPPPGARGPAGAPPPGASAAAPPAQQMPEIEWSPEKRDEIAQGLEMSIKQATAMSGCLRSSNTPEEMDACMQNSGLSPKRR